MKAIFNGMSDRDYEQLSDCAIIEYDVERLKEHEHEQCEISIDCLVDEDDFESNYYNAKFSDGFEVYALSGMYFSEE